MNCQIYETQLVSGFIRFISPLLGMVNRSNRSLCDLTDLPSYLCTNLTNTQCY